MVLFFSITVNDDRRRSGRRDDNRRHTMANEMMNYAHPNQSQQQQPRQMDVEVGHF